MRITVLAGAVLAALLLGWLSGTIRAGDRKDANPVLDKEDKLTADDPKDTVRKQSHAKIYKVKLQGQQVYRITVVGKDKQHDPYLRIEDAKGQQLAENDDESEGNLNSKLIFRPAKDGEYSVIVTTFPPAQLIEYRILIKAASKEEAQASEFQGKLQRLATLPPEQRKEVIGAFVKELQGGLNGTNVRLLFGLIQQLENSGSPKAGAALRELAQPLVASDNSKLAKVGKILEGTARRLELPGKEIEVKGTRVDGKAFDWKSYRGKVVLVDFWATWCGPCRAELPRVKKLYEQYREKGFEVVGISLDRSKTALEKFLEEHKLPWVNLYDEEQPLAEHYGVNAIPLCILVDRQGRVLSLEARGEELERLLEKHIGEKK